MPTPPTFETSAGGLVVRVEQGEAQVALIGRGRRGGRLRWSMPKGHVELGETLEQTAVREVREETGIVGRIVAPLGSFSYTFTSDGRRIKKRVHHFLLRAVAGELSDADVEVTEVKWVPVAELARILAFPAERRIARRAEAMLAGDG
jgi:8-oxo-dGTP pyrophosphatase MutT (NUDIX family)